MSNHHDQDQLGGWVEFRLAGPLPALELFADFMDEQGSGGAIFSEDPEVPGAQMVTAFLAANLATPEIMESISSRARELLADFGGSGGLLVTEVRDHDWAKEWKEKLTPFRLVPGLWVAPTFKDPPAEAAPGLVIRLDPGLAFGTGSHATTRGVAQMMARELKAGESVFDLGTGSGILAMVAAMMGAGRVTAADVDPMALRVADENLKLNGLEGKVELMRGVSDPESEVPGGPYDLVTANLFAEGLAKLMPWIRRAMADTGRAVFSGILSGREPLVLEAAAANGLTIMEKNEEQGWVTLLAKPSGKAG